ncbi:MAG: DUF1501 domain-containing protein [Planctomycetes bacterium]|nr:DUF1501 domain-containing protein [Planctomycetota bacterium]
MNRRFDRRTFLRSALALPAAPLLGHGSRCHWAPRGDDRVLLVLELAGGNDGLATVIPVDDPAYAKARPALSAVRRGSHAIVDGLALHPSLARLALRCGNGGAAAVLGVGMEKPDRSHFRSRDLWHTGDPTFVRRQHDTTGWLGRAADVLAAGGAGMPAASIGALEVPLLLSARSVTVPTFERAEDFALGVVPGVAASERQAGLAALVGERLGDGPLGYAAATAAAAAKTAMELEQALRGYRSEVTYPDTALGRDLQLAARMVIAGFGTRLFHVVHGGFDTHARQLPTHAGLLAQVDAALAAFWQDLSAHAAAGRTAVLVFSEFGRRVAENASQGTDHGAAAPVFVLGEGLRGVVFGERPDLGDLEDGDVKATTDYRLVFGELLRWLGVDGKSVLGGEFAGPHVFA